MDKISVKKLQKSYTDRKKRSVVVLHDFSLDVKNGEFLVLMGESGCGKSTLLRVLAGLEPYDFGDVCFDGIDASTLSQEQKNMSFVTQNYALFPHKTVYENIAEPLITLRTPREERKARITEIAKLLHVEPLLARKPRELSGGQQQRVAIARSLVKEPAVCLFDEPLSALDPIFHDELITTIRSLHTKTSATFVYSTHNQSEAMRLGDRIALIHNRKVEQVGAPQEFVRRPATLYTAKFLSSVFVFFAEVKVSGQTMEEVHSAFRCGIPPEIGGVQPSNRTLTAAFRPDSFAIDPQGEIEAVVVSVTEDGGVAVEFSEQVFPIGAEGEDLSPGEIVRLSVLPENVCLFDGEKNLAV